MIILPRNIFKVYYIVFCINLNLYTSLYLFNYFEAQPHVAQWKCNMCSSTLKFTDSEIMSHIIAIHQQSKMFKCPMCPFEHINDTIQVFEEHFKYKHPSVAAKCMKVYDIVSIILFQPNKINVIYICAIIKCIFCLFSII